MPPSSPRSRRRWSRSWRRWVRCRRCWRAASRSPPGVSPGRTGWPPERGWGPVPQPGGQQAELLEERRYADGGAGLALIRDGNGTRSFETLLRYRGAALAEFWRALRTLKALQAEQAVAPGAALAARPTRSAPRAPLAQAPPPSEPEPPACRLQYVMPEPPPPGRALHEPAAPWLPDEPETGGAHAAVPACRTNPTPQPLLGQTIAADGAPGTAAALLQSMPGVGP
jgi:hypothetical protein